MKTYTFIFYNGEAVGPVPFTVDYTVTITVDGDREHAWKAFKKLVNAYMPGEDDEHVDMATFFENGAYDKDLRLFRLQLECGIVQLDMALPRHTLCTCTRTLICERNMTNKHFDQAATAPKQPFRTVYFEKTGRRYKPAAADFSFLPDVRLPGFYLFHVNEHGYSYSRVEAGTDVVKKAAKRVLAERICALLVDHDRPEPDEPIPAEALKAMNALLDQYPVLRGKRWRGKSFMDLATDIAVGLLNDKN